MSTDQRVVLPDGQVVSYGDTGAREGNVVLYLHGTPGSRMQVGSPLSDAASAAGIRLVAPDRPGYGHASFVPYRVRDYPAMLARFADALGIGRFGVVGTSGGGRYAYACAVALPKRVTRVALVGSTAPVNLPGVPETWSRDDRRLYTTARTAPWLLRVLLARTTSRLRRHPEQMLGMFPDLSAADEQAVARPDVQAMVTGMTAEAFRQGGRGFVHDLRLEALPWGGRFDAPGVPVDVWHGLDDTIVRHEQARILAAAIPGARLHIVAGEGHFSLVMLHSAHYLKPFRQAER